jgi:putative ABC transport system permease protein
MLADRRYEMGIHEILLPALKALRANKLRSALTVLGIIVGVAAVLTVVSLVNGLEQSILRQVQRAGSQVLFVRPLMAGDIPFDEFSKVRNRDLTLADMKALKHAVPQVRQVTPLAVTNSELRAHGRSTVATLLMSDDTYVDLNDLTIEKGRNFVPSDLRLGSKVAIIGPRLAEKLAIKGNPVGQFIQTPSVGLEVIGVLKEQGTTAISDPDSNVLIPLSTGMSLLTEEQRRQLFCSVRIDPRTSAEDGADLVTDALRHIKGVRPKEQEGFRVFSPKQFASIVGNITGIISTVAGGMVSIALLVGGIGIMNIMLVSVTERTREIGVRKAVGARQRELLIQFLTEASLLSVFGGAAGLVLGSALGGILSYAFLGAVSPLPLWALLCAFVVPAGIGIIFGLYPAWKASKLDPVECLRYE